DRGQRLTEVLKQGQYQPLPVEEQVAILWVATNGYLEDVAVEDVREFERQYLEQMCIARPELLKRIADEKAISDEIAGEMKTATQSFKSGSSFASKPAAASVR
ncbi:MAG: hypothetical protein ACR2OO_06325, partial [Thermomicrobiales bacterium]